MLDSVNLAGFEGMYDNVIKAGIMRGDREITFDPPAHKKYGEGEIMVWEPKMAEGKTPGLYNFNGYIARLFHGDEEVASQFITNFKTKGMTLDQSYTALNGGTVLHSDWDTDKDVKRMVFTRLDLSQTKPDGQHPIIRVNAERVNLGALISNEDIVGNSAQKERYLADLQTGKPIYLQVREKVEGETRQAPVFLMLDLKTTKEMTMFVIDPTGEKKREHVEPVMQRTMTKTEGLEVSQENALPAGIIRSLNGQKNEVSPEGTKQALSPDALLKKFNSGKKAEEANKDESLGGGKKSGPEAAKLPDNVKPLLDPNKKTSGGTGKKVA
ncbi:hypothetical protein GCM10011511_57710 [Puia dinghuensis]|uniref:Uncharacterized protein n=2 Tax=Puia dinghuensis TaxID=1792502 RepID=A0A8J2XUI7_9BACT|nr:hypothetical protein GCM10011511_57710 [Puia dinghuensis]